MRVLVVEERGSGAQPRDVTLELAPGMTVMARFASMTEAPSALEGVDIAVIDLASLEHRGLELLAELLAANPQASVLVTATRPTAAVQTQVVAAGSAGLARASPHIGDVISGLRRVA